MTLDNHTYSVSFFVLNNAWFEALPEDLQQVVLDASAYTEKIHRETSANWDQASIDLLVERGMQVYTPTAEEIALFREATQQSAIDYLNETLDPGLIDLVLSEVEAAEANLNT